MTIEARAWIGSLSAYNEGRLVGEWFDWDDLPTDERDWCQRMRPNVTDGETLDALALKHEELNAFDYEGYGSLFRGQHYVGLNDLWRAHGIIVWLKEEGHTMEWLEGLHDAVGFVDRLDLDEIKQAVDNWRYLGEYDSLEDCVEEFYEDFLREAPEPLRCHIDWEGIARDWQCGGVSTHPSHGGGVYIYK